MVISFDRKARVIGNSLEILFTPHELCDSDHERRVVARAQALLTTADENSSVKFRPCDVSKEIRSLKLGKACGMDGIPNECLKTPSKKISCSCNALISSLLSTPSLPGFLEAKARQEPEISPKFTSD
jgi:hypothetical protein